MPKKYQAADGSEYRVSYSEGGRIREGLERLAERLFFTVFDKRKIEVKADRIGESYNYRIVLAEGYTGNRGLVEDFNLARRVLNEEVLAYAERDEASVSIRRGRRVFNWFGLRKLWNYLTRKIKDKEVYQG